MFKSEVWSELETSNWKILLPVIYAIGVSQEHVLAFESFYYFPAADLETLDVTVLVYCASPTKMSKTCLPEPSKGHGDSETICRLISLGGFSFVILPFLPNTLPSLK